MGVDNPEFGNIFVYGARSAFHIFDDKHPYTPPTGGTIGNGTTHKLIINSLDADFTKWAIFIDNTLTSPTTVNIGILNHNGGDLSLSNISRAIKSSSALEIQQTAYIQISQLHDQNVDKSSIHFTSPDVMISCPLIQVASLYADMASWNNKNGMIVESTKNSCDQSGRKKPDVYVGMPIMQLNSNSTRYTNGEANLFVPKITQLY